jgi:uncharacterized membrane protein
VSYDKGSSLAKVSFSELLPKRDDVCAVRGRQEVGHGRVTISRALAKTITFRTIATTMDFTTTYVAIGDLAQAVSLSAFGFVIGPFVYLGHEMAWNYFSPRGVSTGWMALPMRAIPAADDQGQTEERGHQSDRP